MYAPYFRHLPGRLSIAAVALAVACAVPALAETWYVAPSDEIPIRRGIGTEYKIIAVAPDGTEVDLVEEQEGWAFVRLQEGKEGWLPKRYLRDTPPPYQQVALLQKEKESLLEDNTALQSRLDELSEVNTQTAGELTACIADRDQTTASYEELQHDAADTLETKERLAIAEQQAKSLQENLVVLQAENSALKKNATLRWFLAGSGVLLVGWLLGLMSTRSRKRRSSLL